MEVVALIKEDICVNVGVFVPTGTKTVQEIIQDFTAAVVPEQYDEVVSLPEGYDIGDKYVDGVWHKKPTEIDLLRDQLESIEDALNFLIMGGV